MKIVIVAPRMVNYASSLGCAFERQNHDVKIYEYESPERSYWHSKLAKLGIGQSATSYVSNWQKKYSERVLGGVKKFAPDLVVVLNGDYFDETYLYAVCGEGTKTVLVAMDGVKRFAGIANWIPVVDKVVCLDQSDIQYVKNEYGVSAVHHQFGYDPDVFFPVETCKQDIDISFVGAPTQKRLQILRSVASYAKKTHLNFVVAGGGYWSKRYWWKKLRFAKKYSPLQNYTLNENVMAEQAAEKYRRSKICLNLHIDKHDIVNNRCFEIMARRGFMLCDDKPQLHELFNVGEDLVVYKSEDDLLEKIDYYLKNETERERIARNGLEAVQKYGVDALATFILTS